MDFSSKTRIGHNLVFKTTWDCMEYVAYLRIMGTAWFVPVNDEIYIYTD